MAFGLTRRKAALLLFYGAPILMFLSLLFKYSFLTSSYSFGALKCLLDMSPTRVTRILGSTVGTLCPNKWKLQIRNGAGTGAFKKNIKKASKHINTV